MPNLAIELLAASARRSGHEVDTLHASLLQPRSLGDDLIHGLAGQAVFVPIYHDLGIVDAAEEAADAWYADFSKRRGLTPAQRDALAERLIFASNEAGRCLAAVLQQIPRRHFDVIGFSISFDAQKLPAATIARALRMRGESSLMVAGGTGTDESMGPALLEQFPEFDLVLQGEADTTWVRLLDSIAQGGEEVESIPGCVYRRGGEVVATPGPNPGAAFLDQPWPDYAAFAEQKARSRYAEEPFFALFETSRGCWWGRRHQCTFCGIKNVIDDYRVRDPDSTIDLITTLYDQYQPDLLYATDAIAPSTYQRTVWPALADARRDGRDWRIFYETKSNMDRRSIARLAAAGVTRLQPGIETFSTNVLRHMNKGSTGLQQIAFLKWAMTYGIRLGYGIIVGTPGETAQDLADIVKVMERLHHLQPPADLNPLVLHRFSPHFRDPASFGITDVRPFELQRVIYRCPEERLRRLCYQLDFRVPDQDLPDLIEQRQRLATAFLEWQTAWANGAALWMERIRDDLHAIVSSGYPRQELEIIHDPLENQLLRGCEDVAPVRRIAERSGAGTEQMMAAARRLEERGLFLLEDGRGLALPAIADAVPELDAAAPASRSYGSMRPERSVLPLANDGA